MLGADLTEKQVQHAQQRHGSERVQFVQCDALQLSSVLPRVKGEKFDIVVSSTALNWVNDIGTVLQQMSRVVKKDGHVHILFVWGQEEAFENAWEEAASDSRWNECFEDGWEPACWLGTKWKLAAGMDARGTLATAQPVFEQWCKDAGLAMKAFDIADMPVTVLDTVEDMRGYIEQWCPHLQVIPDEQRSAFMDVAMEKLLPLLRGPSASASDALCYPFRHVIMTASSAQ